LIKDFVQNHFIFDSKIYIQYNKSDVLKKEKPRQRRFANFKKICIWGLGYTPTSVERDIPFPCLQSVQILFFV
jgi:hypothetical protein